MNKYLKIVLQQYQSRGSWSSVASWIFLKVKKVFKSGYSIRSCNKDKKIDILIPTILKDFETLRLLIESLSLINHKINKIYIVSPTNDEIVDFCEKNNIIHIDDLDAVGFSKKNINYVVNGLDRSGWLYQQLIKLSCDNITELKDVLVIDSDTIFVNKNCFFSENKFLFFTSTEWHQPYFDTFKNIFGYAAPSRLSFISHMMIFNHDKLKEMKKELEKKHNKSWQEVYLSTASPTESSCISEYDTYANWMLYNYPNEVKIYPFYNKNDSRKNIVTLNELCKKYPNLKSVSFHSYIDGV
jgi:hypothetical protein